MLSLTSSTFPSAMRTIIAPSPSTRARKSVLIVFVRRSAIDGPRLVEGFDVEGAEDIVDLAVAHAEEVQAPGQRRGVRCLLRSEAAVAAAVVRRADRAAACVRDRAEARRPVGDRHADGAAPLALHADALRRDVRPAAV